MQSLSGRLLSDSHVVLIYEWAERSQDAVLKCTCRQVRRIRSLPSFSHALGGQDLFLHYETPGLVAEVCGMIVGVTPKENQVLYEVDDGTSVLRIIETRKSLREAESRRVPADSNEPKACGIPECYIMPPQVTASSSALRLESLSAAPMLAPLHPRFAVADIVKCTGRIQIDRDGNRYLAAKSMDACKDINAEALHQIDVINLENHLYRQPFDLARIDSTISKSGPAAPPLKTHTSSSARRLISDLSQIEQDVPALVAEADDDESQKTDVRRQRLSRDEARRLLSRDGPFSPSSAEVETISPARSLNASYHSCSSLPSTRKLRSHDKIADHKLTEAYFQLQLQQHISLHHRSGPFFLSDLSSDANLASLADRLVRLHLQLRQSSRRTGTVKTGTSEQHAEKVKRLFEWAIRKMMRDGFITLSDLDQIGTSGRADAGVRSDTTAESYRLVTPEYLLPPLRNLLGGSMQATPLQQTAYDIDDLTTRLHILDDRFRFVSRSLVQDSLDMYNTRYAPIVIE